MGLRETLAVARAVLDRLGVRYAVIGGLALGAHGVHRATLDVDVLVDGRHRAGVRAALVGEGFEVIHDTADVLQLARRGALDILWANRPPTQAMLADALPLGPEGLLVVRAEDLIGLKIQALVNDPRREHREKADIQALAAASAALDRERVRAYAELFDRWSVIEPLLREA